MVLTGQGDEKIAVQLMKAGACDYISKASLSPENLYQTVRQTIRVHRAEVEAALANQKLRESEERYRLVLEGSNDGIWDWYCATDEVYCNDRLLEIIGVSRSEFSFTPAAFTELMHPDDLPRIQAVIRAHLTRGEKCEAEFRMRHVSGAYRYCIARGKAQHDVRGCPLRMSGIISDITEGKQLEEALRISESRFRRLAESNIIGIILTDLSGNILEANQAFLEMLGYTKRDLITGIHWLELTPPEYALLDQQAIAELRRTGVCASFEKECIRKDGSRVPILLGAALVEHLQETAICFVIDLSERKQSEAEIVKLNRDLERRVSELQALLDVIPIGIAIAQDPQCQHIQVNPTLAMQLKLPTTANASKSAPEPEQPLYKVYKNGRELDALELPMQCAASEGVEVLDAEFDLVIAGEPTLKMIANAVPLFDEQGKTRGSVGVFWDITERKRVEEQERFLAEASALLVTSLDFQTTLENLASLVIPQLADWCSIYIAEEDGSLRLVTVTHADPLKQQWGYEMQCRYPVDPNLRYGIPQVIRSGNSIFYPEISDSFLAVIANDSEHLQSLRAAGLKSLICVPMNARGRTLGAISLMMAESGRIYNQADLVLAEDIGRRTALAVDNARLYQEANNVGENLRQAITILGEQQQQLRVLQRITNLLNQRLTNLPGLLQVMVGAVCDGILEAEFCLILLHNNRSKELELTATAGLGRERMLLTLFDSTEGLLSQVFLTGKSQLQQQEMWSTRAGEKEASVSPKPASIYAVAIESALAGRLGVLAIGNWRDANAFDVEDQNLLDAVGEQAAIAINNARMINALEEREERLAVQNETLARQNRELELIRQQIERQNLQLIEAARLKSQFLATMSHELRTPMNAVIGFAQVLLRQRTAKLNGSQSDMVQRILNNGKNLLALINDILDLSKIESGRLKLKLEEFNLTQLVVTTIAELQPLAEQKQLPLKVNAQLNNPIIVNDSNYLRQVLVNLLSNAIKFTETGSVEVTISESPTQIIISVEDTGIGIAESDLVHIFEEFRQVDQTTTRKHSGTGLGLAITKSLVHIMKGNDYSQKQTRSGFHLPRSALPRYVKE